MVRSPRPRLSRRSPNLKLTASQAQAILAAPVERRVIVQLAKEYQLSPAWVSKIRNGHTKWTPSSRGTSAPQAAVIAAR
jgi:hypothetical protein